MLVECGANISAQDEYVSTALHLVLENDHAGLAQILVEWSADMSAQANNGSTTLHLASENDHADLEWILVEAEELPFLVTTTSSA
jgi:ankyrin repeat protein